MDTGNLLQGLGFVVCIGAVILVVLVFLAFRAMTRNRNTNTNTQQEPTIWNTPGQERPRYDSPDVQTQGGFGGMPATGGRDTQLDPEFDQERNPYVDRENEERASSGGASSGGASSGDRLVDYNRNRGRDSDNVPPRQSGGFGGQQNAPRPRRDKADDDDIRSSGGFGGG